MKLFQVSAFGTKGWLVVTFSILHHQDTLLQAGFKSVHPDNLDRAFVCRYHAATVGWFGKAVIQIDDIDFSV